jgi:hypothetical protein
MRRLDHLCFEACYQYFYLFARLCIVGYASNEVLLKSSIHLSALAYFVAKKGGKMVYLYLLYFLCLCVSVFILQP